MKAEPTIKWMDNIEIFEMLDTNGYESIGFREFCVLVYLLAAQESS